MRGVPLGARLCGEASANDALSNTLSIPRLLMNTKTGRDLVSIIWTFRALPFVRVGGRSWLGNVSPDAISSKEYLGERLD
jgi:hypothetical protein